MLHSLYGEKLAHFLSCAAFTGLHSFFNYRRYFCSVQSPTAQHFFCLFWHFFLFSMFCCLCSLSAHFTILFVLIFCCFFVFLQNLQLLRSADRRLETFGRTWKNLSPAASKAPSTVKGYHSQFQKWKAWAAFFPGVACFPASALHFSLYLISLVKYGYSFATINSAY